MIDNTFPRLIFIRVCIVLLQYAPLIETFLLLTAITLRYPPSPLIACTEHITYFIPPSLLTSLTSRTTILLLAALLTAELIYITTLYLPHKSSLTHEAAHPPLPGRKEREELFDRVSESTTNWDEYLKLWFLGAEVEEVKRENVREFLLWAFFDRDGETKSNNEDIEEELESYLVKIETLLGRKLPPGRGSATSLRLTFDAIDTRYRSVVWYGVIALLDLATHFLLAWHGYTHYRPSWSPSPKPTTSKKEAAVSTAAKTTTTTTTTLFPPRLQHSIPLIPSGLRHHTSPTKHLSYYLRPHQSRTQAPVVFIHGIGIGLWSYTTLLSSLKTSDGQGGTEDDDGQIGILAIELLPISSRLTGSGPDLPAVLSHEEFLSELEAILAYHNNPHGGGGVEFPLDKGFTLVTHSYGSTLVAPILRSRTPFQTNINPVPESGAKEGSSAAGKSLASLTKTLILTDPVSICLHLPSVAYNFTRRAPRGANEWQLWYFASTDLGIARALGRGFFWRRNILWREDLEGFLKEDEQKRVMVCLAGRDLIVDAKSVRGYLGWGGLGDQVQGQGTTDEEVKWEGKGNGQRMRKRMGNGVEIIWYPRLDHAQMFESGETLRPVLDVIGAKS